VSSVTVLQHLPYDEQGKAIQRIASLVESGGHVLMLENTRENHSRVVFPNSRSEWVQLFESVGFELVRSMQYDYSPVDTVLRAYYGLTGGLRRRISPPRRNFGRGTPSRRHGIVGGSRQRGQGRFSRAGSAARDGAAQTASTASVRALWAVVETLILQPTVRDVSLPARRAQQRP